MSEKENIIDDFCANFDVSIMKMKDFDSAFLGVLRKPGEKFVACYDYGICIEILMSVRGVSRREAIEDFEKHIFPLYKGEYMPYFLVRNK